MKATPKASIGDEEGDDQFQKLLNECNIHDDLRSSTSTLDRFQLDGPLFEKQKKSKFKQRTLQRNAGFIEAGRMKGNVGDQSLDKLLRFINGDAENRAAAGDKKPSLESGKGLRHNDTHLKIQSGLNGERVPDSLNSVASEKLSEIGSADSDESESATRNELLGSTGSEVHNGSTGSEVLNGSTGSEVRNGSTGSEVLNGSTGSEVLNGSTGSEVLNGSTGSKVLNGSTGSEVHSGSTGSEVLSGSTSSEVVEEVEGIIPEIVVVADIFDSGEFEETETEKSVSAAECIICVDIPSGNFTRKTGVKDATFESTGAEFSVRRKDLVDTAEFPSISSSRSDGAETVKSSEDESNLSEQTDRFIVVQKRKRNRFSKTAKSRGGRESPTSSVIEYGSKAPTQRRNNARDTLSMFLSAKLGKSKFSSSNRDYFHRPWNDIFRDKNRRQSDLTLRSSGSENSSTCSVPILKSAAPSFVSNDETDVKCARTNVAETNFRSDFDRRNSAYASKNRDTPNNTPIAGIYEGNSSDLIASEGQVSKNCSDASEQVATPAKISSSNSSSNATSSRPVVFLDARRSPTEKLDVTFGFDADSVSASKCDVSYDLVGVNDQSICAPDSQYANGFYDYCCLPCVNQFFDDTVIATSSANAFSNHMHHSMTSHFPVAYGAFGSYPGFPYALPASIPVGIVPPYIIYDYGQANSASTDCQSYENVNDATLLLSKSDFSVSDVREMNECEKESFEDKQESCSANVEAQLDSAVSNVAGKSPNVFHLADAQRYLLLDFQAVISRCTQFSPDSK